MLNQKTPIRKRNVIFGTSLFLILNAGLLFYVEKTKLINEEINTMKDVALSHSIYELFKNKYPVARESLPSSIELQSLLLKSNNEHIPHHLFVTASSFINNFNNGSVLYDFHKPNTSSPDKNFSVTFTEIPKSQCLNFSLQNLDKAEKISVNGIVFTKKLGQDEKLSNFIAEPQTPNYYKLVDICDTKHNTITMTYIINES